MNKSDIINQKINEMMSNGESDIGMIFEPHKTILSKGKFLKFLILPGGADGVDKFVTYSEFKKSKLPIIDTENNLGNMLTNLLSQLSFSDRVNFNVWGKTANVDIFQKIDKALSMGAKLASGKKAVKITNNLRTGFAFQINHP